MTDLTNELRAGDLIEHTKFGLGKVLDVKLQHVLIHFKDDNLDVRAQMLLEAKIKTVRKPMLVAKARNLRRSCIVAV